MTDTTGPSPADRRVALWLFAMCALICLMVTVGGATRLTDSGLSIVEWRPVTGAIPPLSAADWEAELSKYRQIPEYQLVNKGMSLAAFKEIYWWEWSHRFLGRLIGLAFLVPLVVFAFRREISGGLALKLGGVFLLGGAQGALGWWMVTSGLTHRIDVSQYRLAAHLGLAVILLGLMFWTALSLQSSESKGRPDKLLPAAIGVVLVVYGQMMLGAFVAGLRAGRIYTTWPLMDGRFFPDAYFDGAPGFADMFESPAAAQFNHRIGAYITVTVVAAFAWAVRRSVVAPRVRMLFALVLTQIGLGIWTLLAATPVALGLVHQLTALAVFLTALWTAHGLKAAR